MAIRTTCIGAYPKPSDLPVQDWFQIEEGLTSGSGAITRRYTEAMSAADAETEAALAEATRGAIEDQIACGVDIPTDGEQRRENYIHYHCRHLEGFDFDNLSKAVLRDGAYSAELPTITRKIQPKGHHFLDRDFEIAQSFADRPVKITVPGPTTIMDTTVDQFYRDERRLAFDLADALNFEIRALAGAGWRYIQIDEPLFARNGRTARSISVSNAWIAALTAFPMMSRA